MTRVMVIGLNQYLSNRLLPILERGGCEIVSMPDERGALGRAKSWPPDIVILRSPRPEEGRQHIPALRQGLGAPLIVMGPWGEDGDGCVQALEDGADDFLGERCAPLEVLARIRAILRRWPAPGRGSDARTVDLLPAGEAAAPDAMSEPEASGLTGPETPAPGYPAWTASAAAVWLRHQVGGLLAQGGAPLAAGLAHFRPKAGDG